MSASVGCVAGAASCFRIRVWPGTVGAARGYIPPTAQLKSENQSPWARQWTAGPVGGILENLCHLIKRWPNMLEERQKLWAPKECLLARPSYLPRGTAIVGGDYVKWKCFFWGGNEHGIVL